MKNVVVVHGCPSDKEKALNEHTRTYDKHWMPWLKTQLSQVGIKSDFPLMPNPWSPVYEDFKTAFENCPVNEETVLIGHSCGGAFLVHWLGDTKAKVAKLILVAPWKVPDLNDEERKVFYGFDIDPNIPSRVKEIVMFISDDESIDGKRSLKMYRDVLGGRLVELSRHGHFTLRDMGTEAFPELLDLITA